MSMSMCRNRRRFPATANNNTPHPQQHHTKAIHDQKPNARERGVVADLGVVAAIASSFKERPIDAHTAVFGEVGLTGEVRGALQAQVRAREAQALGFKKIVMPASNTAGLERLLGLRVVGVRSVEEALDELF